MKTIGNAASEYRAGGGDLAHLPSFAVAGTLGDAIVGVADLVVGLGVDERILPAVAEGR